MESPADDTREWEFWLLIAGACLGSAKAREQVFGTLEPDDCPYKILRPILRALKENNVESIKKEFAEFNFLHGVDWSGGVLNGMTGKVKRSATKRAAIEAAEQALQSLRDQP